MKKKLFSLIMAIAMVASLAIPALAADDTLSVNGKGSQTGKVTLTGGMSLPSVNVTMPKSGATILNPYKMKVKETATLDSGAAITTNSGDFINDQVLSARHVVTNKTEAPLNVGIAISATPSDSIVLATAACTGKETTKSVFMFAEAQYASTTAPTDTSLRGLKWSEPGKVNAKCYPQIVAGTEEASNPNFFVLPTASSSAPNYFVWTISGNTATAPDGGWLASDKVSTTVAFTFTPTILTEIVIDDDNSTTGVATLQIGSSQLGTTASPGDGLTGALGGTTSTGESALCVPMGAVVRVEAEENCTISAVEVKDAVTGTKVTSTKVNTTLYYFAAPANGATVKITGTVPTP